MPFTPHALRRTTNTAVLGRPSPVSGFAVTLVLAIAATALGVAAALAADEVHWTIMGQTSVSFDWRGPESSIAIGLVPGVYTRVIGAYTPTPLPDSSPGPFWEARITDLFENTVYYYRVGNVESSFRTPPARGQSGFWLAALADVGSSLGYPTVRPMQEMIAGDNPNLAGDDRPRFVLVPGDLTYGDNRGRSHVDAHFNDVMVWSRWAAYMPTWGNHEWGSSEDDLQNYEGRFDLPNSQTSSRAPSTGGPGEDWYWFDYGNVRFVAFPEPYSNAWDEWEEGAGPIMAQAQADPAITFIVVFGHRPPFSSGADHGSNSSLASILGRLKARNPKLVLTLSGHSHHYERSNPDETHGILHVITGGGGSTVGGLSSTQPSWSAFRLDHLQHLKIQVKADRIEGYCVCGPVGGGAEDECTPGTVVDRWTILAAGVDPDDEEDGEDDGGGSPDSTIANRPPFARIQVSHATGPAPLEVTVDASMSTDPDGDRLDFGFLFGDGHTVPAGSTPTAAHTYSPGTWSVSVVVTDVHGARDTAAALVTVTDVRSDSLGPELVTNPSFEADTEGWTTYGRSAIRRWPGGHHGRWSLHVRSLGYDEVFGLGDHPNVVARIPLAGMRFRVSAWVRPLSTLGQVRLLVREFKDDERVGSAASPWMYLGPGWQQASVEYQAVSSGSYLDIQVLEDPATVFESFFVDDVSVRQLLDPVTLEPLIGGLAPDKQASAGAISSKPHDATALESIGPRVIPNPMFGNGVLAFTTSRPGPLRVGLYDASGRMVRRLRDDAELPAGAHQLAIPGRDRRGELKAGIYFCVVHSVRGRETVRVAIVR